MIYHVHAERDREQTPVAILEVDEGGKITKATKPEGDGLPTIFAMLPPTTIKRTVTLNALRSANRGMVFKQQGGEKKKVEKTAYKIVSEQTGEDAGYILVDDATQAVEGYSGDSPPVGFVLGQPVSDFEQQNRGYKIEAITDPLEEVGEEVEIDTAGEAARLIGIAVGAGLQASGVISKADEEQQIVYGWAYVTHDKDGILKDDKSGDFVDDVHEIEKSAVNFMLHHRASDLDHTNEKGGDVVESMVFTPEKRAAMGIPEGILPNGWWIGVKCNDEQWAGYKSGRTAFSIHGSGTRKAAD